MLLLIFVFYAFEVHYGWPVGICEAAPPFVMSWQWLEKGSMFGKQHN